MNNSTMLFQERLEQLEAGHPLELCLEGLPEQEAAALRFAAALRQIPIPDEEETAVAAQRVAVLQAAARNLNGRSATAKSARQGPQSKQTPPAKSAALIQAGRCPHLAHRECLAVPR